MVKFSIYLNLKVYKPHSEVINLIGTYECKVDAKGRMLVPAAIKKQLSPVLQEGFVVKRSLFEACLELYPMAEWHEAMKEVNGLNRFRKKNNDFIRKFTAGVKIIEIDAAGRLLIPKDLIGIAGIKKEIVLSSAINIIEIWDKEKYEEVINDSPENIADLAEEVMGNDDADGIS